MFYHLTQRFIVYALYIHTLYIIIGIHYISNSISCEYDTGLCIGGPIIVLMVDIPLYYF